eukprot:TRINITY_DN21755_c0_g1_i5.p1 TRINITY_DN21755_c0_g1~~TRINITY_DN21755_c0_g1_i5.p1  ORF type:complete len:174 (+),score=23.26 TRINITY_DN21755_c0_g1_i5:164-685(+)
MLRSLVGSEMCIRDRYYNEHLGPVCPLVYYPPRAYVQDSHRDNIRAGPTQLRHQDGLRTYSHGGELAQCRRHHPWIPQTPLSAAPIKAVAGSYTLVAKYNQELAHVYDPDSAPIELPPYEREYLTSAGKPMASGSSAMGFLDPAGLPLYPHRINKSHLSDRDWRHVQDRFNPH